MNDASICIISNCNDSFNEKIVSLIGNQYSTKCYSHPNEFIPEKIEKPLLKPTNIIILCANDFSIDEINKFIASIKDNNNTQLNAVLYIADQNILETIYKIVCEEDDVLPNSFSDLELINKLKHISERSNLFKKLTRDLQEASDIALLSMSHSSELGEISRFILKSYNCKNYEELLDILFETTTVLGVRCSALVIVDDTVCVRIDPEANTQETREKMLKQHQLKRIQSLKHETYITYAHASILVHNMPIQDEHHYGRLMDNLSVLGNCFEARVKGIHAEEEADAASRAKTMFLATMSHELRTPMNSVIGFTERLIKKLEGRLNEKESKHLLAIKRNGDHLLNIINEILDMSKIEVGAMEIHPEEIDINDSVLYVFQQLQPIAQNNKLDFSLSIADDSIIIEADRKRFIQIVMNLVSNAIKYTEEGSVLLSISDTKDDEIGECISVSVTDTGIGISQENQEKLFGNFVQIDSALSRQVEGTGLGLAISMVFANMHGGRIDVQSEIGKGSCFTLLMPKTLDKKNTDKSYSINAL